MSIVYKLDLYPRLDPVNGVRVRRFTQLQEAECRGEANDTGSGKIVVRGTSADATAIDPKGLQYVRQERLGDIVTLALSAAADDVVDTAAAHGLVVGDKIEFITITGGAGISLTPVYFVKTVPTTTSMTLSATRGGATLNFTTDITAGTIRKLTTVAGFFLEYGDFEALTEHSTKRLTFKGAGALSYLDRAVAAATNYIGAEGPFDDTWHWYFSPAGAILHRMVTEALDVDRPQIPIAGVTVTFGEDLDSDGNPWPGYGTSWLFTAQVTEGLVSIIRRLLEAGVYVWMNPDTFALSAWMANAHGRDRTGVAWGTNVIRFQAPTDGTIATGNIKSDAKRGIAALVKRSDMLVGAEDVYEWVNDPTADLVWEGGYRVVDPSGVSFADIGAAQLGARSDVGDTVRLRMFIDSAPTTGKYLPFEAAGVLLDDHVTLHTGTGQWDWNETEQKVAAISLKLRPGGDWDGFVDLGSKYSSIEDRAFSNQPVGAHNHPMNPRLCGLDHQVETSITWKMATTGSPPAGWHDAGFDDSAYANPINVSNVNWYDNPSSRWIWQDAGNQGSNEERSFRTEFSLVSLPKKVTLVASADNGCEVYINGTLVATVGGSERGATDASPFNYSSVVTFDVDVSEFVIGANCISIIAWNETHATPGPAAVYAVLTLDIGGTSLEAARCDHPHLHNDLLNRDAASAHPATAVTEVTDGTVQSAIDKLRARAWKQPVRAATTAAGTLATSFENGDTIDGVVLATGDRILIKDQAAGSANGIYVVAASGAPTRATDFDASSEVLGAAVFVTEGTANGNKAFFCTTDAPITLGTTALAFAALSGGGSLSVEEADSLVSAAITTLDFRHGFDVGESPAGEANVDVDETELDHALIGGTSPDIPKSLLDAKGDIIAASADNTPAKVTVGTNNKVLTADSSAAAGVSWQSIGTLPDTTGVPWIDSGTNPDRPPGSPNTEDDEFDAGSLDAKWTQGGGASTPTFADSSMHSPVPSATEVTFLQAYAPGASTAFKIRARFAFTFFANTDYCGLTVADSGGTTIAACDIRVSTGLKFNKDNPGGAANVGVATMDPGNFYLEIARDASNVYTFKWSNNGIDYSTFGLATGTSATTVDKIGFRFGQTAATTYKIGAIDWFRRS